MHRFNTTKLLVIISLWFFPFSCSSGISPKTLVPVEIDGAGYVGAGTCKSCHFRIADRFKSAPHNRIRIQPVSGEVEPAACEYCHGPGSRHVQSDENRKETIVRPSSADCFRCHSDIKSQFGLTYRHPVSKGSVQCKNCHDPHGSNLYAPMGIKLESPSDTCLQCHKKTKQGLLYEHEALRSGCTICHTPHGSNTLTLLKERENGLCLKCHVTPGRMEMVNTIHPRFMNRNCWASGCHEAVHGSNLNPKLQY